MKVVVVVVMVVVVVGVVVADLTVLCLIFDCWLHLHNITRLHKYSSNFAVRVRVFVILLNVVFVFIRSSRY